MSLDTLIEQSEIIKRNVSDKENFSAITEWLSSAQVYLETKHSSLKETEFFIRDKERFKALILEEKKYSIEYFDSLVGTLKGVKIAEKIQEDKIQAQLNMAKNLNRRNR
ncbi:hypothetical protein [Saccharibacillus brassicae]|uniref:Uncharacterized protein n=1 Tax=Saccharibacillus brassicae TaxID=2583377 RepID=A0A4Y6UU01_SACBS|nr:hypothetical protein [Saccharibacillus brassicae]QDH19817.1 hypothetical protein FFV09_02395 [Saccharibacillus brassicae]